MKTNSTFKLFMKTELSSTDFKVLSILYQPLIGIGGFSLYSTFYQMSKINDFSMSHQTLLDLLNINQQEFIKLKEKLEAFGLIETFSKNESNYIYFLKPPYSAKKFLVDTFLGRFLESEIGSKTIKSLYSLFKVTSPDVEDYINETKSFDEIYTFKSKSLLKVDHELEERNGNNTKLIKSSIDYNLFVEKLPRALQSPILFNDNFKEKVIQLAYVYQFSIDDLLDVYAMAHKGKSRIDIEQLNLQARILYQEKNKDIKVVKNDTPKDEVLENLSFKTIVDKFVVGDPVVRASALSTINDFINQNEIDRGALNVLLIFILKSKEGVLPHVNYLNKVWADWSKNGVVSASDALKYQKQLEQVYKNYNNNKNISTGRHEVGKNDKLEWMDKYYEAFGEEE